MKFLNKNYLEEDHNKTGTLVDKARQKQERIAIHLNTPSMLPQSRDNVIIWLLFNYIKTSKENYFEYWIYKIYTKYILFSPLWIFIKKKKINPEFSRKFARSPFFTNRHYGYVVLLTWFSFYEDVLKSVQ